VVRVNYRVFIQIDNFCQVAYTCRAIEFHVGVMCVNKTAHQLGLEGTHQWYERLW
jgi:hypothetical protein